METPEMLAETLAAQIEGLGGSDGFCHPIEHECDEDCQFSWIENVTARIRQSVLNEQSLDARIHPEKSNVNRPRGFRG
tara:strand:+ start:5468 stop:5701 length:234 start_codon:yes stop_codon:yes gene_type:complete